MYGMYAFMYIIHVFYILSPLGETQGMDPLRGIQRAKPEVFLKGFISCVSFPKVI